MSASRPARVKTNVQDRLVRGQLDKILSSNVFARTERLRNFLRFIVKESLQGRADSLKEQVLACEIYGRGADFEAAIDPVVRVDARRLRDKLREYYSEFPNDPLIISLPKGGYAPAFERNPDSIGVVQEIHREKPAPSSAPGSADQQPKPTQVRRIALAVAAVGEAGTSGAAPGPSLTQVQRSQRWHRIAVGSSALVVVAIAIIFAMWLRSPETMPPPSPGAVRLHARHQCRRPGHLSRRTAYCLHWGRRGNQALGSGSRPAGTSRTRRGLVQWLQHPILVARQ